MSPAVKKAAVLIYIITAVWFFLWTKQMAGVFKKQKDYYHLALRSSPADLQRLWCAIDKQSLDFYRIITTCDRLLPTGEKLSIIWPALQTKQEVLKNKRSFLREKARYLIYPRYLDDDRTLHNYILVYQNPDYIKPQNYETATQFSQDSYLLQKKSSANRQ